MVLWRLRWFYLSCLAAFTAGHMINYSVVMYAQEAIGLDWLSGLGFGLCFGPPLVLGWYAGVLCDQMAPGRLIHAAHLSFLLATLLLWATAQATGHPQAQVAALLAAAALAGVGWSFAAPARMAALGQVARAGEIKPASVAFNLLVMLGFGLGPLCIAVLRRLGGWPSVFAGAAVLFVLGSLALTGVRTRPSVQPRQSVGADVRDGLAAVAAQPLLRQLMLAATAGYLAMGPMTVLLPKLAATQLQLGELQRGAFLGTLALSLIAGGALAMIAARRAPHGIAILSGTLLAGAGLTALGTTHDARAALALLGAVGVAGGSALSLIVAGIQAEAPHAARGRVVSMYTIISQVVPAASGVCAGALVQAFGVGVALQICGAVLVAIMLLATYRMRPLRHYRG